MLMYNLFISFLLAFTSRFLWICVLGRDSSSSLDDEEESSLPEEDPESPDNDEDEDEDEVVTVSSITAADNSIHIRVGLQTRSIITSNEILMFLFFSLLVVF